MKLKPQSEIIGTLTDFKSMGNTKLLVISQMKVLEIPNESVDFEKLENLIGKKIGIFNNGDNYKIRLIKNRKLK